MVNDVKIDICDNVAHISYNIPIKTKTDINKHIKILADAKHDGNIEKALKDVMDNIDKDVVCKSLSDALSCGIDLSIDETAHGLYTVKIQDEKFGKMAYIDVCNSSSIDAIQTYLSDDIIKYADTEFDGDLEKAIINLIDDIDDMPHNPYANIMWMFEHFNYPGEKE